MGWRWLLRALPSSTRSFNLFLVTMLRPFNDGIILEYLLGGTNPALDICQLPVGR
jgi:hypothetical protein